MTHSAYRTYLLTALMVILASNYVDRLAFGLLLQDIKADLQLTDTQLGFLSGIAFAFFYGVMGIPLARWADRGNRVTIISVATALWSVAVALCGLASSFMQLTLIRIGAAIGEAGCIPTSHSLISDYFSRAERPRAFARYMLGVPIAVVIGYFGAGWLNELYGWRTTFILLGSPGIVLAVLAWMTLKEPRRDSVGRRPLDVPPERLPLKLVCTTLWRSETFRNLLVGNSIAWFFGMGIQQWQAAFFIRSFSLRTGELGTWFTLIGGVCGLLGTYLGGEWAARYAANNERLQLRAVVVSFCSYAVISIFAFSSNDKYWAFGLMAIGAVIYAAALGPLFATMQVLVSGRMRAVTIAIVYLFGNLIGFGFGPVTAGALSDELRPWLGEESLRYALLALWPGFFAASWYIWLASRTVMRDLQSVPVDIDVVLPADTAFIASAEAPHR